MKALLRLICASLLLCTAGAAAEPVRPPADHVVLVSIDGLRPEFYRDPAWPAPTLKWMRSGGVAAVRVRGIFPSTTYPSHTTIITGALPVHHRIDYNRPFEPEGPAGRWNWEASLIRVPTLWDAVRAAGGTTVSIGWPVSVGAPVDHLLPELWSLTGESAEEVLRRSDRPDGLVEELEREVLGHIETGDLDWNYVSRDDRMSDAAAYLLATYRPTLMTLHLIEVDHFEHDEGRDGPTVAMALAAADRGVGKLVEAARRAGILERTAFVVTGDHGMVDIHAKLAPNVWLSDAGLVERRPDAPGGRGDWRAVFHTDSASAFLHLRDPADRAAAAAARAAVESQPPEVRALFRIVERDELDRLGAAPDAVFALDPRPGIDIAETADPAAVGETQAGDHGYVMDFPEIYTGLVAWGAGVRAGAEVPEVGLEQIAPLVAHLLGLDFRAPDGTLPDGLLSSP
jgi:Type I phosphodiesterase / nucleotide pyrophosphatase